MGKNSIQDADLLGLFRAGLAPREQCFEPEGEVAVRGWAEQESHTKGRQSIIWGSPESHNIIALHGRKAFRRKEGSPLGNYRAKDGQSGLGGAQK